MPTPEDDPSGQARAWAAVVQAVLDARATPAADRFDAELDRARAEGRIDADTARALRWWQRASVREVADQVVQALPPTVAAVDRARAEAVADADRSARAWDLTRPADALASRDADARESGDADAMDAPDVTGRRPEPPGGAPAGRSLVVGLTVLPDDNGDDAGRH